MHLQAACADSSSCWRRWLRPWHSSYRRAAARELFFEETAEAFWAVPHQCADGSTVQGTLLVSSTRDFNAPDTDDPDPTARVQFLAVCPGGFSFSWGAPTAPAAITSAENLKSVHTVGRRDCEGQPRRHPHSDVRRDVDRRRADRDDRQRSGQQEERACGDRDRSGDVRRRRPGRRPQQPPDPASSVHSRRHGKVSICTQRRGRGQSSVATLIS